MSLSRLFFRKEVVSGSLAALTIVLLAAGTLHAQLGPSIIGDRPSQISTISPHGSLEIASALLLERTHEADVVGIDRSNYAYTSTLHMRYGLVDRTELRFGCEYATDFAETERCYRLHRGVKNLSIGSKTRLRDGEESFPEISLFTNLRLPVGHETIRTGAVLGGQFQLDYTIDDFLSLTGNVGCEWKAYEGEALMTYSTTAAVPIFDRSSLFLDIGGEHPVGYCDAHHFDIGVTYELTNQLRYDVAGGLGLFGDAPTYVFFTGFSFAP